MYARTYISFLARLEAHGIHTHVCVYALESEREGERERERERASAPVRAADICMYYLHVLHMCALALFIFNHV